MVPMHARNRKEALPQERDKTPWKAQRAGFEKRWRELSTVYALINSMRKHDALQDRNGGKCQNKSV